MTNYNERLGKILVDNFEEIRVIGCTVESIDRRIAEAKQAINSLFKELVVEAKPTVASKEVIETYLQNGMTQKAAECHGRNQAIDQFEQNLLKALEEK